jgi:arsenate reductase (glutaredoxin)
MLHIYTLSNCDRCREATKWLRSQGIPFAERAIRETPPTRGELQAALAAQGGELRKLFNTAGRDYREQKIAEKLSDMKVPAALSLLAGNGNLVKRPFLVGDGVALTGFDEHVWAETLAKR